MSVTQKIGIAADHAGFELKQQIIAYLQQLGWTVEDFGTHSLDSVDYPDFVHPLASSIQEGQLVQGILICGSGNGVNITANRHAGIRSALCWKPEIARLAREHNDANIVALPARFITLEEAKAIVDAFLSTAFEGGRHQRRVEKIEC